MKAIQTRWLLKIGVLAVVCAALPADAIWGTVDSLPNSVPNNDNLRPVGCRGTIKRKISGSGGRLNKKEEDIWQKLGNSPERIKKVYEDLAESIMNETVQVSTTCLNVLRQVRTLREDVHELFQNSYKMALDEETIALAILSGREDIESLKKEREKSDKSLKDTKGIVNNLKIKNQDLEKRMTSLEKGIANLRAEVSRLPAQKPASDPVPSASPEGTGGAKEKTTETLEQDKFNKVNRSKIPKKKKSLQKTGDKKSEQEWSEMLERIGTMEHKLECLSSGTDLYEKLKKANVTTAQTVAQRRNSIWDGVQEKIKALQADIKQLQSQAKEEFKSLQNTFGTYRGDTEKAYNEINDILGKFRDNSDSFSKVLDTAKTYSEAARGSAEQAQENAEETAKILQQFEEARKNSAEFLGLQEAISVYLEQIKNYEKDVSEYASWHREELGERVRGENPELTLQECLAKKTEELKSLDEQYQTVVAQYKRTINDYKVRLEGVNTAAAALEVQQSLLKEKTREADEKLSRLDSLVAGIKTDKELQEQYNELFDQFEKKKDALRTLLESLSMTKEDLVRPHGNGKGGEAINQCELEKVWDKISELSNKIEKMENDDVLSAITNSTNTFNTSGEEKRILLIEREIAAAQEAISSLQRYHLPFLPKEQRVLQLERDYINWLSNKNINSLPPSFGEFLSNEDVFSLRYECYRYGCALYQLPLLGAIRQGFPSINTCPESYAFLIWGKEHFPDEVIMKMVVPKMSYIALKYAQPAAPFNAVQSNAEERSKQETRPLFQFWRKDITKSVYKYIEENFKKVQRSESSVLDGGAAH